MMDEICTDKFLVILIVSANDFLPITLPIYCYMYLSTFDLSLTVNERKLSCFELRSE